MLNTLYPPDWNPSDEYFAECQEEFAIAANIEDWEEISQEYQQIYLEELQLREAEISKKNVA